MCPLRLCYIHGSVVVLVRVSFGELTEFFTMLLFPKAFELPINSAALCLSVFIALLKSITVFAVSLNRKTILPGSISHCRVRRICIC